MCLVRRFVLGGRYPTLAELTGTTPKDGKGLDGVSLAPVFDAPATLSLPSEATFNKSVAYSQFPHNTDFGCPWFRGGSCFPGPTAAQGDLAAPRAGKGNSSTFMGFSVRDASYRFTVWLPCLTDCTDAMWASPQVRHWASSSYMTKPSQLLPASVQTLGYPAERTRYTTPLI